MPQTSYPIDNAVALAGQVVDREQVIGHLQNSEALEAGVLVEVHAADGKVRHPQNTHGGGDYEDLVGIAIYRGAIEPNGFPTIVGGEYKANDYPPLLRQGKAWVKFNGTPPTSFGATVRIMHASDDTASKAQYRGWLTDAAASNSAGAEVSDLPTGFTFVKTAKDPDGNDLALIEINRP